MDTAREAPFFADTRVERVDGSGRYRSDLSDAWNAPAIPFGGVVSAIAVRAMQAELGSDEQRPRTITTMFASQVRPGPLDIHVTCLRAGRTASQLTATLRNAGDDGPGHVTMAVFGGPRRGFEFTDLAPPEAPPPEACPLPEPHPPAYAAWRSRAFENLEWRRVRGHAAWDTDWEAGGPAEVVRWMRFLDTPRLADGRIDPLALLTLADTMPGSIGQKLGPNYPLFFGFSCDLTLHLFEDTTSDWFLQKVHCRRATAGYASADIELWDTDRRLIAWGTQMMFLAFPNGNGSASGG